MMTIPVAGEVNWAAVPASAAPTPCMAIMPADCRPWACPLSSSGVRETSRSCSIRLAAYPTDATVTAHKGEEYVAALEPGRAVRAVLPDGGGRQPGRGATGDVIK
jgi:hypothetical protein